jgi:hypothetical protein
VSLLMTSKDFTYTPINALSTQWLWTPDTFKFSASGKVQAKCLDFGDKEYVRDLKLRKAQELFMLQPPPPSKVNARLTAVRQSKISISSCALAPILGSARL